MCIVQDCGLTCHLWIVDQAAKQRHEDKINQLNYEFKEIDTLVKRLKVDFEIVQKEVKDIEIERV